MKYNDVFETVASRVGLKENKEYLRLYNPKDLYGPALESLAVRNFKRFIAILYYIVVEKKSFFDLVIGAGDSGIALTKIVEMFYKKANIQSPPILNIPITRFKYGFDLYDNSILIPEVQKKLEDLKNLNKVLIVDDEISNGVTLKATLNVLLSSTNIEKVTYPLTVTLVAEDQDFKSDDFMDQVTIKMYPFSKKIEGMFTVVRYIVPWKIEQKIRKYFNDDQIGSKSLINLLLDLPIKETTPIHELKLPIAKFTNKELNLLKKEVPEFKKFQEEFKASIEKWIDESIKEYSEKSSTLRVE